MKVNVKASKVEGSTNNVKGLCTVTWEDCYAVKNIYIVENKKGENFISMPSFKTKTVDTEGNPVFKDIAFPITKEFREVLFEKILESFDVGDEVEIEV